MFNHDTELDFGIQSLVLNTVYTSPPKTTSYEPSAEKSTDKITETHTNETKIIVSSLTNFFY